MATTTRIDWNKAERDYIGDPTMSFAKIAFKYGVSETSVKEWAAKRQWTAKRELTTQKILDKLPEKIAESVAEFQARKFHHGKQITDRAMEVLTDRAVTPSPRTAKEMIDTGYALQTEAMGLDNPKIAVTMNQQNNTFISLTDFMQQMQKRKQTREGGGQ